MNFLKYIIVENIPAFRNSLVDKINIDSIPLPKSYMEYCTSKKGSKRSILSSRDFLTWVSQVYILHRSNIFKD